MYALWLITECLHGVNNGLDAFFEGELRGHVGGQEERRIEKTRQHKTRLSKSHDQIDSAYPGVLQDPNAVFLACICSVADFNGQKLSLHWLWLG
jgi:hypothetical protein